MIMIAAHVPPVNLDPDAHTTLAFDPALEDYRPTAGPAFIPSLADQVEAVELLNCAATDYWPAAWPDLLEVSTISDWDYQAEAAWESERIAAGPLF